MNHRINAWLHKLPECPECGAAALKPCIGERGTQREPHHVRARIAAGEIVIRERVVRECKPRRRSSAEVRDSLMRAVDNAVDQVRRSWGINKAARSKR